MWHEGILWSSRDGGLIVLIFIFQTLELASKWQIDCTTVCALVQDEFGGSGPDPLHDSKPVLNEALQTTWTLDR